MNTWCIHGLFQKTQTNNINEAANQSLFLFHYLIAALEFNVRPNEIIVYMKKFNFKSNNKKRKKKAYDMTCAALSLATQFGFFNIWLVIYRKRVYL